MNKTQLAEKRQRDKLKKSKKEIRLNNKNYQKQNKQKKNLKKFINSTFINYEKQRRQQRYKRKNYIY